MRIRVVVVVGSNSGSAGGSDSDSGDWRYDAVGLDVSGEFGYYE